MVDFISPSPSLAPNQSPLPTKIEVKDAEVEEVAYSEPTFRNFTEVISEIISGKKAYRLDWEQKDEIIEAYGYLNDGFLMIKKSGDKKDYQWLISESDMKAEDWIII